MTGAAFTTPDPDNDIGKAFKYDLREQRLTGKKAKTPRQTEAKWRVREQKKKTRAYVGKTIDKRYVADATIDTFSGSE